jgi:uncharacterized protein
MIIKHTSYLIGIHNIDFVEPCEHIGLGEPFFGNVTVNCRMDKSSYQIVLDIKTSVPAEFECDRCNDIFQTDITSDNKLVCLFKEEDIVEEDTSIIYLAPEQDKIDISNDVSEFSLLSIPMKKVCKEDCKGLCPKCGTNLNTGSCKCDDDSADSVWDPLLKLKEKLNNN